jgi:hypothetical protein
MFDSTRQATALSDHSDEIPNSGLSAILAISDISGFLTREVKVEGGFHYCDTPGYSIGN